MRFRPILYSFTFCVLLFATIAGPVFPRQEGFPKMFEVEFTPVGIPKPGAPFDLTLTITGLDKWFCSAYRPFQLSYQAGGKLELLRAPVTEHIVDSGQTFTAVITIRCAANDTAWVRADFKGVSKGGGWSAQRYVISDDTSVVLQRSMSRDPYKVSDETRRRIALREALRTDSVWHQKIDAQLNEAPLASRQFCHDNDLPIPPVPGVPILSREQLAREQKWQDPADSLEVVWIEGEHWYRQMGQSAFQTLWPRRISGNSDCLSFITLWPHMPKELSASVVIYLPSDLQADLLKSQCSEIDSLGEWWRFQLYRVRIAYDELLEFRKHGAGFWLDECYPKTEDNEFLIDIPQLHYRLQEAIRGRKRDDATIEKHELTPESGSLQSDSVVPPPPRKWPNLAPWTPNGWMEPLILRSLDSMSALHTTPLYVGEPFYFGWGAQNSGDTLADQHANSVEINLDGSGQWTQVGNDISESMSPGQTRSHIGNWTGCNYACIPANLDSGWYQARLLLDKNDIISEGPTHYQETDNHFLTSVHLIYPEIEFSGTLQYVNPRDSQVYPVCQTKIEMCDHWMTSGGTDSLLDSATTDDNGQFHLGPVRNFDREPVQIYECARDLDIYLRYSSENPAAKVVPAFGQAAYRSDTSRVLEQIDRGQYDTVITIVADSAGPYAVAEAMLSAREQTELLGLVPASIPKIEVRLANLDSMSQYYFNNPRIHIEGSDNASAGMPDTFDRFVLCHEYGHYLEDQFSFFDKSYGGWHSWWAETDTLLASTEGFATFFACFANSSNRFYNYWDNFQSFVWRDVETGEGGSSVGGTDARSVCNLGRKWEGAVAGILWDLYDTADDNFSKYYQNHDTALAHWEQRISDTQGDSLGNLITSVVDCLGQNSSGAISQMWESWISTGRGHAVGMADIMAEHGIGCYGFRGDVCCDGLVDVSDLSCLISYMTGGGCKLHCLGEANTSADSLGRVDLSDLNALISYLQGGGYVMPRCPADCWEMPPTPELPDSLRGVAADPI